jgi:hypothetical protein
MIRGAPAQEGKSEPTCGQSQVLNGRGPEFAKEQKMSKAIYVCLDSQGQRLEVQADTMHSVEEIKALAAQRHGATIQDVVSEVPVGKRDDEDDEDAK